MQGPFLQNITEYENLLSKTVNSNRNRLCTTPKILGAVHGVCEYCSCHPNKWNC